MFKSCAEEHVSLKSVNVEAVHISATWRATIKVPLGAACSANLLLQSWCAQHMMCKSISPGCSLLCVCNCASALCTCIASSVMEDMGWTLEWFTSEQSTTFRKVCRRGLWYLTPMSEGVLRDCMGVHVWQVVLIPLLVKELSCCVLFLGWIDLCPVQPSSCVLHVPCLGAGELSWHPTCWALCINWFGFVHLWPGVAQCCCYFIRKQLAII